MTPARVHRLYEPEALDRAADVVDELIAAAAVLERYQLASDDVRRRIAAMLTAPVAVRCSVCRRRRVVVDGIAGHRGEHLRCEHCVTAACDVLACYTPAAIAVDRGKGTSVLCTSHGLEAVAAAEGAGAWIRLRHIVDGTTARAVVDLRNGETKYRRRSA